MSVKRAACTCGAGGARYGCVTGGNLVLVVQLQNSILGEVLGSVEI